MNEVKKEIERPELFHAIKESITDARHSVQKLAESFSENIRPLRLEESEQAFMDLGENIRELQCIVDFTDQLGQGLVFFHGFGMPQDPLSFQNSGLNLFQDMHEALESKDWILLSDLIEYELSPLLLKEDEWLCTLEGKIAEYEAQRT